ncbi:hypothetical protein HHUSO_G6957 [Huso huso]|uniref:Uncharacterized protein n=1 Tax=Huso huso TaxID=61971 RepID=A0ABR0ZYU8_HUSHU
MPALALVVEADVVPTVVEGPAGSSGLASKSTMWTLAEVDEDEDCVIPTSVAESAVLSGLSIRFYNAGRG